MVENIFSVLTRYQVICQLQIFPAEQLYSQNSCTLATEESQKCGWK